MYHAHMKTNTTANHTEPAVLEFLDTAAGLERRLDRALSGTKGISFSEYRLLKALSASERAGVPRIDLAAAVGLTPSAVTRALKPLEKLGYVTTLRNERDARQSLAAITPAGTGLLKDARAILQDDLSALPLNHLGRQKLAEFLQRLQELR